MAITKNTYSTSHAIDPYYIRIVHDPTQAGFIIIDDIEFSGERGSLHEETSGSVVWLQVEMNNQVTVLVSAPIGVSVFTPSHSGWSQSRIYVKSAEAFVVQYSSVPMDDASNRTAVTGYQLGSSSDVLYIKIDQQANTITMYQ